MKTQRYSLIASMDLALSDVLPPPMTSDEARLMMLAIQGQEDPGLIRYQLVKRTQRTLPENVISEKWAKGPGRGAWQFEQGGGVKGVLEHPSTGAIATYACLKLDVLNSSGAVWRRLEHDDILSACFARLLLWSDPKPLPKIGDEEGAWNLYLRTWRPGAYANGSEMKRAELRAKWHRNYKEAMTELGLEEP